MNLRERFRGFLIGQDEAVNALCGGAPRETISGTVGRAAIVGRWWAVRLAEPFVDWLMGSSTHCRDMAAEEERRRRAG